MTEKEQSLRQELEEARNKVWDAREALAEAEQAQAVIMNALKDIVMRGRVEV